MFKDLHVDPDSKLRPLLPARYSSQAAVSNMETPLRLSLRTPKSTYKTPHKRPSRVLTALRTAAKSAPYAYGGRRYRLESIRPETPPTPTPPPKAALGLALVAHPLLSEKEDSSTFEKKTVSNISNDPMTSPLYNAARHEYRHAIAAR